MMVMGWTLRGVPRGRVTGVFRDWSNATWAIQALERAGFEQHAVQLRRLGVWRPSQVFRTAQKLCASIDRRGAGGARLGAAIVAVMAIAAELGLVSLPGVGRVGTGVGAAAAPGGLLGASLGGAAGNLIGWIVGGPATIRVTVVCGDRCDLARAILVEAGASGLTSVGRRSQDLHWGGSRESKPARQGRRA
jgi:hypothetical protein